MAFATCPGQLFLLGVSVEQGLATCTVVSGRREVRMFLQAVLGVSGWPATQAVHQGLNWLVWAFLMPPLCPVVPRACPTPTPLMATILRNCHYLFIFLSAPLLNWQFLGVRTIFLFLCLLACHNKQLIHVY